MNIESYAQKCFFWQKMLCHCSKCEHDYDMTGEAFAPKFDHDNFLFLDDQYTKHLLLYEMSYLQDDFCFETPTFLRHLIEGLYINANT